ncbi:hypothetical protein Tco_0676711 [Tanacetum coccineum]
METKEEYEHGQREIERECDATDRANRRQSARTEETCLSENEHDRGGQWNSKSKKQRSTDEEDLSQPWLCEETDPFTAQISNEIHQGPCGNLPYEAKEGKSMEAFMERFKAESMHDNGVSKCMRISGFMHGITNPDLIKRLNDNIC